ncbi:hypothetical protein [Haladaptatus salinisoli]|uniref:hypothetical protein n=1 Tax=Haladaptatus salinisoli TaxID=2884876 RepID=UPI001D09ED7B|nr:hypothetical protein [Haladaptatus salinisoli]
MGYGKSIGWGLAVIALFVMVGRFMRFTSGQLTLEQFLTPGWISWAGAHPTAAGFILVFGTLVFGKGFVIFIENI